MFGRKKTVVAPPAPPAPPVAPVAPATGGGRRFGIMELLAAAIVLGGIAYLGGMEQFKDLAVLILGMVILIGVLMGGLKR